MAKLHPLQIGLLRDIRANRVSLDDNPSEWLRDRLVELMLCEPALVDTQGPAVILTQAGNAELDLALLHAVPRVLPLVAENGATVPMHEIERQAIEAALVRFCGDKSKAARALQIGRSTLYRHLNLAPWHAE